MVRITCVSLPFGRGNVFSGYCQTPLLKLIAATASACWRCNAEGSRPMTPPGRPQFAASLEGSWKLGGVLPLLYTLIRSMTYAAVAASYWDIAGFDWLWH